MSDFNKCNYDYNTFCEYSIPFKIQYPDYTTFNTEVVSQLLIETTPPIMGWETLYKILMRRFKNNEFKSLTTEDINCDVQNKLDEILNYFNQIWNTIASSYFTSLSIQDLIQEGLVTVSETTDNDETTDQKLKDSPQTLTGSDLNLNYLTQQVNNVITRDTQRDSTTTSKYTPIYENIAKYLNAKLDYRWNEFFNKFSDIFITVKGGQNCG